MVLDNGLKKIILFTLCIKASVLLVISLGSIYFDFWNQNYFANFFYSTGNDPNFFTRFKTWDAQHYLFLADHGYAPHQASDAFPPLFPFLIHLLSFLFLGNSLAAGLFLSTLFTVFAMVFLFLLVRKMVDEKTAFTTCALLIAFPSGFFVGLIYTESLFLMLTCAFFYYLSEKKMFPAFVCAFLLPLTRLTGIFVLASVLVDLVLNGDFKKKPFSVRRWMVPLGFVLGLAAYFLIMKITAGDYFAGFESQTHFASGYSFAHVLHPFAWISHNFFEVDYTFNQFATSSLNRLLFILFIVGLVFGWKRLSPSFWVYSLVLGLIPALSDNLTSYLRYGIVVFPLFILAALKLKDKTEYYLWICLPLQMFLALLYSLNDWVA